jgi:hypothetical protein
MSYHFILVNLILAAGIVISGFLGLYFRNRRGVGSRFLSVFGLGVAITSVLLIAFAVLIIVPGPGSYFRAKKIETKEDPGLSLKNGARMVMVTFSDFSPHSLSMENAALFTVPYQGTYVVSVFFVRSPPDLDVNNDGGGNCYVEIYHGEDIKSPQEIALVAAYRG